MLKGRVVPQVLEQLNTSGTIASILLTSKGAILGCSTAATEASKRKAKRLNVEVVSGVVANIWQDFTKNPQTKELETITIALEHHNIVASEVCAQFIVCCVADKGALLGMVKLKHQQLCKTIAPVLSQIDV